MQDVSNQDTKPSPPPSSGRVEWVDLARGVGIILVVLGHALGGIIDSTIPQNMDGLRYLFLTIYSFHMPLFFFLAGIFIYNRLQSNRMKFLENTFTKIGRSYFTWAIVQISIIYMMGDMLNHPAVGSYTSELVAIIWKPVSQYWFLYALFFMQIISFLLVPYLGRYSVLMLAILARLGLEIYGLPHPLNLWPPLGQLAVFGLSFAIGVAVGPSLARIRFISHAKALYIILAAIAWIVLGLLAYHLITLAKAPNWLTSFEGAEIAFAANDILFYPAAIAGTLMIIFLCSSSVLPFKPVFAYLGKYSMGIFLMHVIFVAGSRIIITKLLGNIDINILVSILTLIGIIGPLIVLWIAQKLKIDRLLALV